MSADKLLILGSSSSGKSTSLRNLNSKSTVFIQCENKRMPFKNSNKFLTYKVKNYVELLEAISDVLAKDKNKNVKTIVLDDYGYLMSDSYMKTALEQGYSKFTKMALDAYTGFKDIPEVLCANRDDILIVYVMHPQKNELGMYTPKTIGKLLDEKICIEGMFEMVLFSIRNEEGEYVFLTQTTADIPSVAKTPMGMFDTLEIPNDLNEVIRIRNEYYGIEQTK